MIASFIVAKWYAAINISALGWVKIEIPHEEKGGGGKKCLQRSPDYSLGDPFLELDPSVSIYHSIWYFPLQKYGFLQGNIWDLQQVWAFIDCYQ